MKLYERLDYRVNTIRLAAECLKLVESVGFKDGVNQIGLVNPPDISAEDRYTFSTGRLAIGYTESQFTEFHPDHVGSYLHEVFLNSPYKIGRFRIMMVPPRGCYSIHKDFGPRLHIPLITNPQAMMLFPDVKEFLHMPANSYTWMVDTTVAHTAMNGGTAPRYHLVGCVLV
jgi:hypothetical protein